MQRALFQQVSPCKPCADPHASLPEKGTAHTRNAQRYVEQIRPSARGHAVFTHTRTFQTGFKFQQLMCFHQTHWPDFQLGVSLSDPYNMCYRLAIEGLRLSDI